jgi:hypothetical protein
MAVLSDAAAINILKSAYRDALSKEIPFVCALRDPGALHSIKKRDLTSLFTSLPLWEQPSKGASGHVVFKNKVTGVVVGFQGHSTRGKDSVPSTGILKEVLGKLQLHLNILGNDVFGYIHRNYKKEPDYKIALKNVRSLKK